MKSDKPLCGCGYGKPTHPMEGSDELRLHVLGEGSCARMQATGNLIPTNFRMQVWTHYAGTEHEQTFLTEVCDVNGQTITTYTLYSQRLYAFDEDFGIWTMPKDL